MLWEGLSKWDSNNFGYEVFRWFKVNELELRG